LVCVGGAGRSSGFASVAKDPTKRKKFGQNLNNFLKQKNLHGIDLNWEAPTSESEWADFSLLITDVRQNLDTGFVFTVSLHPGQDRLINEKAVDSADMIHIMAYDAQKHSPFELVQAVRQHAAIPLSKMTLGIPFYGRHARTGNAETYANLVAQFGPLKKSKNEIKNYLFNGINLVKKKTRYALSEGMSGIMIWELGQDVRVTNANSLLKAIYDTAVKSSPEDATDKAEL